MEILYKIILYAHIFAGFTSLISGLGSMVSRKGGKLHRRSGKIFFFAMLFVSASAIVISIWRNNMFFLMIGIFAFYQNYNGYRAVHNKSLRPSVADYIVLLIAAVNSAFMVGSLNMILMIFGAISSSLVIGDTRLYLLQRQGKVLPKMQWLARHIGMMIGSYIATSTAFLVQNAPNFNPYWLPWLMPTFCLVPLTIYWTRKYTVKRKPLAGVTAPDGSPI